MRSEGSVNKKLFLEADQGKERVFAERALARRSLWAVVS
jgi:hypothetical protein